MPEPPLKRVEELFNEAVALPPEQRSAFLDEACGSDADLRAAVEVLLRYDDDATDVFRASPIAREADAARQLAPTLPARKPMGQESVPQLPEYEIMRVLGRGGMGVVFLALHRPLKRLVALKMLAATPAPPEQLARFRTEAEVLARLHHPNIVPIYDVGEWESHPYFTMEYVAGPSLADLLDGRPRDATAAAELVETLARAVHAVHQCGIVHRDIKPANILFSREESATTDSSIREPINRGMRINEGVPKLTDFGIAKDQTSSQQLTQPDMLMGTPCYMAPEQVRNSRSGVGPGADVYALGSILYELLTGRPPFDEPTSIEVIGQLLNQEPLSPSRLRPRLPADMATICLKCLEKSPRRRYESALDLAEDLRRFQVGEPIHARPVGPVGRAVRWCLRRPLVAGLLALSACLTVALVITLSLYNAVLAQKDAEEQRQIVQLNVTIGDMEMQQGDFFTAVLRFSEAMSQDRDDAVGRSYRSRIIEALRNAPRLLRLRFHERHVLFTNLGPSGGRGVTLTADSTLEVWDLETGKSIGVPLKPEDEPTLGALSPDGQLVVTIGRAGKVEVGDVATGRSWSLSVRKDGTVVRLVFTPSSRTLIVEYDDSSVQLWDLKNPERSPTRPGGKVVSSALSDDGRWLFTVDAAHSGQVWDLESGEAVGPSLKLDKAVTRTAISLDGRRVALVDTDGVLHLWDAASAQRFEAPTPKSQTIARLAFSPDGERVIAVDGETTVRVWDVAKKEVHELHRRHGAITDMRFSRDGRLVIVGDGTCERVWDALTGQPVTPPLKHGIPLAGATCNADGNQIIILTRGGTVCEWDLHPREAQGDPSPEEILVNGGGVDEILVLARLLDSGRISKQQQREALSEQDLREAWSRLHPTQ